MTELSVQIYNTKRRLSRGRVKYFAFRAKYFTVRKGVDADKGPKGPKRTKEEFREFREIKEFY